MAPGEIHLADVFEGGLRPVVVVSREELNRGDLCLAVPITTSRVAERRGFANYVFLQSGTGGLRADSVAVCHLVQPVRAAFFKERWGRLPAATLAQIVSAIAWSVGLVDTR
jgi:mRNA-degrading endonuclease toxin of MazEF toxin-antitoxin module